MARKPRIQFPGALYHVINRGNYRKDLFSMDGSGEAFESALHEVAVRCCWRLHAYAILGNHYHAAIETPDGNLVEGMQWLQGTFANRFNRFRGESGHVFQGRYKAILVEPDRPLLGLVNYIHLNPVRAGICRVEDLRSYSLSSFPKFFKRRVPEFLDRSTFLSLAGFPDSAGGMKRYWQLLEVAGENDPARKDALERTYCRGWALASKTYKKQLREEFNRMEVARDWGGSELRELNQGKWENVVLEELRSKGKNEGDVAGDPKGAAWKIEIARRLRKETSASNPWIAGRLNMGHPSRVSLNVGSRQC